MLKESKSYAGHKKYAILHRGGCFNSDSYGVSKNPDGKRSRVGSGAF